MPGLALSKVLEVLDADATIEKRASWGGFEFTLLEGGRVEVVNGSHDEPGEHIYTVHVEAGIPFNCTCPAFEYQDGACKHMVAVTIREPVLEAPSDEPITRADGGVTVEAKKDSHSDKRPDECDCLPSIEDLPCWPCYRDGFEEPNRNTGGSDL